MKKVIILSGPTASGKSNISLQLSQYFNFEIISADSMAIYKFMDIGTDKPEISQRNTVKHHMIDIIDPKENYSVYLYSEEVKKIIDSIHSKNKIPLVVGGTGLYIESLFHSIPKAEPDWNLRNELYELEKKNPGSLYRKLKNIDPIFARTIDKNNTKRIVRSIEIFETTKKLPSVVRENNNKNKTNYEFLKLYIDKDREKLYNKIDKRVEIMIEKGLVEETKYLFENNFFGKTSSKAIGYRETIDYIKGLTNFDRYIFLLKRNSRRYAKRQISWFKRYKDFRKVTNLRDIFYGVQNFVRGEEYGA